MKNKIKKISKYTTNILGMINLILLGLNPIWNIPYCDKITDTLTVLIGAIGVYLIGGKLFGSAK